jgi:hypothetical protein
MRSAEVGEVVSVLRGSTHQSHSWPTESHHSVARGLVPGAIGSFSVQPDATEGQETRHFGFCSSCG